MDFMPKKVKTPEVGKHRFKPMARLIRRLIDAAQLKAREIYEKAFPERQEYPPTTQGRSQYKSEHLCYKREGSRFAGNYQNATRFNDSRKISYEVQGDGSLRALNKPVSKVKKIRLGIYRKA